MIAIDIKDKSGKVTNHWEGDLAADGLAWVEQNKSSFPDEFTVIQTDVTAQAAQAQAVSNRSQAREKCLAIIDQIAALNESSSSSPAQMDAMFSSSDMIEINLALLTGAPQTAARKIQALPQGLFPQNSIDQIVAELQAIN